MKVKVYGLDKLSEKLKKNQDLTPIKEVLDKRSRYIENRSKREAPYKNGTLRRSITRTIFDNGLSARIEPMTDYAQYLEYGTRFMEARPYMRPAFYEQVPKFINDLKKLVE